MGVGRVRASASHPQPHPASVSSRRELVQRQLCPSIEHGAVIEAHSRSWTDVRTLPLTSYVILFAWQYSIVSSFEMHNNNKYRQHTCFIEVALFLIIDVTGFFFLLKNIEVYSTSWFATPMSH